MVDVIIAPDCNANIYNSHEDWPSPVWVTSQVGYQFYYTDEAPVNFVFRKTTDGGLTWSAKSANINNQLIEPGEAHAVYYADWTSGITTGIVHVVWTQLNRIVHRSFDTATDTFTPALGLTPHIILTIGSGQATHVNVGVIEGGELWCAWNSNGSPPGQDIRRSPSDGSSWSDPGGTNPIEANGADAFMIMPARTGDTRDMWMIYFDETASEITLKAWDNSITDFLAESAVIRAHNWAGIDGSVAQRHSDGHLFLISHSNASGAHDLTFTEIEDGPIFTNRTNILTGVTGPRHACITIDQQTGRIYVAWLTTLSSNVGAVQYSFTDDSGASWSTPVQFTADALNTLRTIYSSLSIADGSTGRWMPTWHDHGPEDFTTNFDNSIVLGAGIFLPVTGGVEIDYTPFFGGASLNVVFDMQVESWKHILIPQPILINLADFENRAISLNKVNFDIEVEGVAVTHHATHPLTAGEGHVPDVTDLEEMALLFNRGISTGVYPVVRLTLNSDVDIERRYQGVIKNMILFQEGGINVWRFKMLFGVDWNISRPALREWA